MIKNGNITLKLEICELRGFDAMVTEQLVAYECLSAFRINVGFGKYIVHLNSDSA